MKAFHLAMMIIALPLLSTAQQNQTLQTTKKEKEERKEQNYQFPDNTVLSQNELNERVEAKTKELTGYIKLLAKTNYASADAVVNKAMKLFNNNEQAMVTVTRKSQAGPITVPVRTYLKRLARLKYDNVQITWRNAQYVSNFTKQPDGTYRGLVAFEQRFTGVRNGEPAYVYNDVTQKRIEVAVRIWDTRDEAQNKVAYMDVFLGNIGVVEE